MLSRVQQIFSKDEEALKAAGGQGLGQIFGFTWSDVALEDSLFGAYELPVFQKAFQGLAESAAEAAASGCPDYEAPGWITLVIQFLWMIFVSFCLYKAVTAGYMKFVWFPKSKDKPKTNTPAVISSAPGPMTTFGSPTPMRMQPTGFPGSPAPMMMQPAGFPGMPGLPVYGMRFGADDITPADCCEMGEMAGVQSVTVTGQSMGQPDFGNLAAQANKFKDFVGDIEGNSKGW